MHNQQQTVTLQVMEAGNSVATINAADISLLAQLSRQTFFETFKDDNSKEDMAIYLEENFNEEAIRQEVADGRNIFILARHHDQAIGYAKLSIAPANILGSHETAMEICRLYVVKKQVGKGIGKLLMDACITLAANQKLKVVWLGVWEHNAHAIAFYKKYGFEKFGQHIFMLGNDAQNDWLMKKMI